MVKIKKNFQNSTLDFVVNLWINTTFFIHDKYEFNVKYFK